MAPATGTGIRDAMTSSETPATRKPKLSPTTGVGTLTLAAAVSQAAP